VLFSPGTLSFLFFLSHLLLLLKLAPEFGFGRGGARMKISVDETRPYILSGNRLLFSLCTLSPVHARHDGATPTRRALCLSLRSSPSSISKSTQYFCPKNMKFCNSKKVLRGIKKSHL
jgi:hypothetical protein